MSPAHVVAGVYKQESTMLSLGQLLDLVETLNPQSSGNLPRRRRRLQLLSTQGYNHGARQVQCNETQYISATQVKITMSHTQ